MNYQPVTAGNQINKNAGPQEANGDTGLKKSVDDRQSEEKNESTQQYIVFPLWSSIFSSYKSSDEMYKNDTADDAAGETPVQKPASENEQALKNVLDKMMDQEKELLQGKTTKGSSTNSFNTVSTPVNAASAPRSSNDAGPSFDTAEVQNTGIFGSAFDDEDLDTYNSPLADQVMVQRLISTTWNLQLFWVEAMQEELLQFKIQKVWSIVDLPYGKKAIGTKTEAISQPPGFVDPEFTEKVYKVEKALYSLHQAPRAWYETLSTYLLDNGFYRGQIDKTLFIKRVSSLGELTFFLGLQVKQKEDGIFISQDKYVGEILKKFGFSSIRTTSTPMETNKALTKDEDGEDVDVHLYKSMIRSLMYLTSSRTDIMFFVCACSRFQVQPKVSHLNAVKRIFRYLKGQPKLGLWYPKDSPFILEAFSDSDYAGASLDRKSTTGGCQFLGSRLISWQCKKQTVVANSTTEAEYIAASHCCGQTSVPQDLRADEAVYKEGAGVQLVKGISLLWQSQAPRYHGGAPAQTRSERVLEKPNEPPLSEGHTSRSGEGNMEHQFELTVWKPKTRDRFFDRLSSRLFRPHLG
ncbi:uncharacterized mitochondrial protein-like protein [Tanacetum coccineum]